MCKAKRHRLVTMYTPPPSVITTSQSVTTTLPGISEGQGPIAPTPTTSDTSAYYHVTEKDNGKTIRMRVGDRIEIDLPAISARPGYNIRSNYEHLVRIEVWTEPYRDHLVFRAIENGQVTLSASWMETWGEIDPERQWEVRVVVGPFLPTP